MIAREHRFHGHGALNFVYRKGRSVRSGFLTLRYVPSRQADYKLAVVVSKKVSKQAVVRNKVRRKIYENVRVLKKGIQNDLPYDITITVFDESVAHMPTQELTESIEQLFRKAKII